MTQEDKELLCKDLSARMLYGVKLSVKDGVEVLRGVEVIDGCFDTNIVYYCEHSLYDSKYIKPYLFPLSSMTEEQKKEFKEISECKDVIEDYGGFDSEEVYLIEIGKYEYEHDIDTTVEEFYFNYEIIDWFNKNHFDWRGLIPMGLANDATGLNIY